MKVYLLCDITCLIEQPLAATINLSDDYENLAVPLSVVLGTWIELGFSCFYVREMLIMKLEEALPQFHMNQTKHSLVMFYAHLLPEVFLVSMENFINLLNKETEIFMLHAKKGIRLVSIV